MKSKTYRQSESELLTRGRTASDSNNLTVCLTQEMSKAQIRSTLLEARDRARARREEQTRQSNHQDSSESTYSELNYMNAM